MLQNKVIEIKGRLLEMIFEQYRDMNTEAEGVDYASFYEEIIPTIQQIRAISTLDHLERFCEEYGLNDMDNVMSFPNLVKEAYK